MAVPAAAFAAAFVVGSLLLYLPVLGVPFAGDDLVVIGEAVLAPPLGRLGGEDLPFLRPLTHLTLWVDHAAWGLAPLPLRAVGVVLHGLAAAAVAWFAAELARLLAGERPTGAGPGAGRARWAAPLAGLVFLVHPSHTEGVAWVAARGDLLATLLGVVALAAWCRGAVPGAAGSRSWSLLSVVAVAAALAAKESAATLPAVLVVLALAAGAARRRSLLRSTLPHWGVLAAYLGLRWWRLGGPVSGYGPSLLADGPAAVARRAATVVVRALAPATPWPLLTAAVAAAVLALTAAVAATGGPAARRRWAALAGSLGVTVAPVAALGTSLTGTGGERLVLLPSVFAAVLLADALADAVADALAAVAARSPAGAGSGAARAVAVVATIGVAAVVAAVVVGGAAATLAAEARWAAAARVAGAVTGVAEGWAPGSSHVVVNLPVEVDGSVAARNALPGGVQVLGPPPWPDVVVAADHALSTAGDPVAVDVERRPDGSLLVTLTAPQGGLVPAFDEGRTAAGGTLRVRPVDPGGPDGPGGPGGPGDGVQVELPPGTDPATVLVWDRGALRPLPRR